MEISAWLKCSVGNGLPFWYILHDTSNFIHSIINAKYFEWRKRDGEWRTLRDVVIYDRFGNKLSFNEDGTYELKTSDAGIKHDQLIKKFSDICYSIEYYNADDEEYLKQQYHDMSNEIVRFLTLFPPKMLL
jgi:hypothetical protein